jgi:hypothetical protein
LARSLRPLLSSPYTTSELKLFRLINDWHLANAQLKTIPPSDCLIRFEELLTFYRTLRELRENLAGTSQSIDRIVASKRTVDSRAHAIDPYSTVNVTNTRPMHSVGYLPTSISLAPQMSPIDGERPTHVRSCASKRAGWIQVNNIFLPYITRVDESHRERRLRHDEYLVPYEILRKCRLVSDREYPHASSLIVATSDDFDRLNRLISDINTFNEKIPTTSCLVNLYPILIGLDRIFYIKFLPDKQPRTAVNRCHNDVLKLHGGTLIIQGNRLIPYIVQNDRFYVPFYYTCQSLPDILVHARRCTRSPRQFEIDYLNLLVVYFSIDTCSFSSDTLLVDLFELKCSLSSSAIHFRTLKEHQQYEKKRLFHSKSSKSIGKFNEIDRVIH